MSEDRENLKYELVEYWNDRYHHEDTYDWLGSYSDFRHLLVGRLKVNDRILVLGCGNSTLSGHLYKDGYRNITNIDYSEVVIDNMRDKHRDCPRMTWRTMDMCEMTFEGQSFDVILEKGTLDAIMVGEKDPWKLSEEMDHRLDVVISKISELLEPNGKFFSISFSAPHFRKALFSRPKYGWSVGCETYGSGFHFFFYEMTKGRSLRGDNWNLQTKHSNTPNPIVYSCVSDDEDFIYRIAEDL